MSEFITKQNKFSKKTRLTSTKQQKQSQEISNEKITRRTRREKKEEMEKEEGGTRWTIKRKKDKGMMQRRERSRVRSRRGETRERTRRRGVVQQQQQQLYVGVCGGWGCLHATTPPQTPGSGLFNHISEGARQIPRACRPPLFPASLILPLPAPPNLPPNTYCLP